ncbi:MAG TPA: DUF4124 domain-containing protein [Ramlibacter sp.]|nr:DUF4124 domain-containing protein [Ramlibacter sp.]
MTIFRIFVLALACSAPALALAQWQWIDGSGRRVYSDQAPPPEVPAKNILRQPGVRPAVLMIDTPAQAASAPAPAQTAAAPTLAASGAKAPAGRDKELEAKRKQAEAAEADKRKLEEERIAKLKVDNCSRARQAKLAVDSGQRIRRMNDKGEPEFLDDAARAAEARRLNEIIASDCKAS